jgi:magnesium transporter
MPIQIPSPLKTVGRIKDALFGDGDRVLLELLPKVGDDELVHTIDQLSLKHKLHVLRALPTERRIKVILDLSEWSVESIMPHLQFAELWDVIQVAESDDAADIIQWLDPLTREKVTDKLMVEGDPHGLLSLLVFDEQTAGGRMKVELLKFYDTRTIADVRALISKDPQARTKSHYIYVVNKSDELVGRISPIRLIQNESDKTLSDVMNTDITALPASMDQEDAAIVFDEQGAIELPVVSHRQKLLGVITADDIFAVMEEEHFEDVSRLAGVHEDAHISDPIWLSARRRIPWLGVNLITAMIAATIISFFQGTIQELVILAAFMPVVAGMGGNAAQQSLAVTIRAMAVGEFRHLQIMRVVAKEVSVGMLNGFLAGVVVGLLASVWTGHWGLGAVLVMAMSLNLLAAGFVGVVVPLVMRAAKADPALSSTVFVTATTDIFGFIVFLGLATILL